MGPIQASRETEQDVSAPSRFSIHKTGDNPPIDVDAIQLKQLLQQMLIDMDSMESFNDASKETVQGMVDGTLMAPDMRLDYKKYEDIEQEKLTIWGKIKDFGRSITSFYKQRKPSGEQPADQDSKKQRGKFGRSTALARNEFVHRQPDEYSGFTGFFKKSWLGAKALFGMDIIKKIPDFKFNDHLSFSEAEVSQIKDNDGKRKFIVNANQATATLRFDNIKLAQGYALNITNCYFDYVYDIETATVEKHKLTFSTVPVKYDIFTFDLLNPGIDFNSDQGISLFADSANVVVDLAGADSVVKVDEIAAEVARIKLGPAGFTWEEFNATATNFNAFDLITFDEMTLTIAKDDPGKFPQVIGTVEKFSFAWGEENQQGLTVGATTITGQSSSENQSASQWDIYLHDINLTLGEKILNTQIDVDNLDIAIQQKRVVANNASMKLKVALEGIGEASLTGNIARLIWSKEGKLTCLEGATASLASKIDIGGFNLTGGSTFNLDVDLNQDPPLKKLVGNASASAIAMDNRLKGTVSGSFIFEEIAPKQWSSYLGEESKGSLSYQNAAGDFSFALEATNISFKDYLEQQEGAGEGQRKRELNVQQLTGTLDAFGGSYQGELNNLYSDGTVFSYESAKLTLKDAYWLFNGIQIEEMSMESSRKKLPQTDEDQFPATGSTYTITELKGAFNFGVGQTPFEGKGKIETEEAMDLKSNQLTTTKSVFEIQELEVTGEDFNFFGFKVTTNDLKIDKVKGEGSIAKASAFLQLSVGRGIGIGGTVTNLTWDNKGNISYEKITGNVKADFNVLGVQVAGNADATITQDSEGLKNVEISGGLSIAAMDNDLTGSLENAKVIATETSADNWDYEITGLEDGTANKGSLKFEREGSQFSLNLSFENLSFKDYLELQQAEAEQSDTTSDQGGTPATTGDSQSSDGSASPSAAPVPGTRKRILKISELKGAMTYFGGSFEADLTNFEADGSTITYEQANLTLQNPFPFFKYVQLTKLVMEGSRVKGSETKPEELPTIKTDYNVTELKGVFDFGVGKTTFEGEGGMETEESLDLEKHQATTTKSIFEIRELKLDTEGFSCFGLSLNTENVVIDTIKKQGSIAKANAAMHMGIGQGIDISGALKNLTWDSTGKIGFEELTGKIEAGFSYQGIQVAGNTEATITHDSNSLKKVVVTGGLSVIGGEKSAASIKNAQFIATEVEPNYWEYELDGVEGPDGIKAAMSATASLQVADLGFDIEMDGIYLKSTLKRDKDNKVLLDENQKEQRQLAYGVKEASTKLDILGITAEGKYTNLRYADTTWAFDKLEFSLAGGTLGGNFGIETGTLTVEPEDKPKGDSQQDADAPAAQETALYKSSFNISNATLKFGIGKTSLSLAGEADPLGAKTEEQDGKKISLPQGYLFKFSQINSSIAIGNDDQSALSLNLNVKDMEINTQKKEGSIQEASFDGNFFTTEFDGTVIGANWSKEMINLGIWNATIPSVAVSSFLSLENTQLTYQNINEDSHFNLTTEQVKLNVPGITYEGNFALDKENQAWTSTTEGQLGVKLFNQANPFFTGAISQFNYDFIGKKFSAPLAQLNFQLGSKAVKVDVENPKVDDSGFNYDVIKITSPKPFTLLNKFITVQDPTIAIKQNENESDKQGSSEGKKKAKVLTITSKKVTIGKDSAGESSGESGSDSKSIFSFSAEGVTIAKDLDSNANTTTVDNVAATILGNTVTTDKVTVNHDGGDPDKGTFDLSFAKPPEVDPGPLGGLVPKSFSVFSSLFGVKVKPKEVSYDSESKRYEIKKIEQKNKHKKKNLKKYFSYLDGDIILDEEKIGDSKPKMHFASPNKFEKGYKADKIPIDLSYLRKLNIKIPFLSFDLGLLSGGVTVGGGYGVMIEGPLTPSLDLENNKINLTGTENDIKRTTYAFVEIGVSLQIGRWVLAGEAKLAARCQVPAKEQGVNANFGLLNEGNKLKLDGADMELIFNDAIEGILLGEVNATFLGKNKQIKTLVFAETTFGVLQGTLAFNTKEKKDDKRFHVVNKFSVAKPAQDANQTMARLKESQGDHDKLLEQSNLYLAYDTTEAAAGDEGESVDREKLPRENWILKIEDQRDKVKHSIWENQRQAFLVQYKYAKFTADSEKKLTSARDHIKKHQYRLQNEQSLQAGLEKWKPREQIIPNYTIYETKFTNQLDIYKKEVVKIANAIGEIKTAVKGDDTVSDKATTVFTNVAAIKKAVGIFTSSKPPQTKIDPSNDKHQLRFFTTMFSESIAYKIHKELKTKRIIKQKEHEKLKLLDEYRGIVGEDKETLITPGHLQLFLEAKEKKESAESVVSNTSPSFFKKRTTQEDEEHKNAKKYLELIELEYEKARTNLNNNEKARRDLTNDMNKLKNTLKPNEKQIDEEEEYKLINRRFTEKSKKGSFLGESDDSYQARWAAWQQLMLKKGMISDQEASLDNVRSKSDTTDYGDVSVSNRVNVFAGQFSGDHLLSHTALANIYSSHAVSEAQKEIKMIREAKGEEAENLSENDRAMRDYYHTISGSDKDLKKSNEHIFEFLEIHRYVRQHTQNRIKSYNDKIEKINVGHNQYKQSVETYSQRIVDLQYVERKLSSVLSNKDALLKGDPSVVKDIVTSGESLTESQTENNLEKQYYQSLQGKVDSEVKSKTAIVDQLKSGFDTDIAADANLTKAKEADLQKLREDFIKEEGITAEEYDAMFSG